MGGLFNWKKKKTEPAPVPVEEIKTEDVKPAKKETSMFSEMSDREAALFAIRKGGTGRRLEVGIEEQLIPELPHTAEENVVEHYTQIDAFIFDKKSNTYMMKREGVEEEPDDSDDMKKWRENSSIISLSSDEEDIEGDDESEEDTEDSESTPDFGDEGEEYEDDTEPDFGDEEPGDEE